MKSEARMLALVAVVAGAAFLAIAVTGRAAPAGQICPAFKDGGLKFNWETVGTGWSCSSAKPWVLKLSHAHVRIAAGNAPMTGGPRGYHCYATLKRKGRVSLGSCFKGTWAYPGSGFSWNAR